MDELKKKYFEMIKNLEELSNGLFQNEKDFRLNEIAVKAYILESSFAKVLEKNGITDIDTNNIKDYIKTYEANYNNEIKDISYAVELFEFIQELKEIKTNKQ